MVASPERLDVVRPIPTMQPQAIEAGSVRWEDCFKQFTIHETPGEAPTGWVAEAIGEWTLTRFASLPRIEVRDANGTVALLLGWFATRGRVYQRDDTLELGEDTFEQVCAQLVGRFVILRVSEGTLVSIQVDAAGQLPVVYDASARAIGSTPTALARFRPLEIDRATLDATRRNDGRLWFPFGLVPYQGVRRLLPGQTLVLRSFSVTASDPFGAPTYSPPEDPVAEILAIMTSAVRAAAEQGPLEAHLTAGVDSRMVLAAVCQASVPTTLTTFQANDEGTRLDSHVAARLAGIVGMARRSIPIVAPTRDEVDAWYLRSGYCIDDAVVGLSRSVRETFDGATVLTGACGEVGRAFYWTRADCGKTGLDPDDLIDRMGFGRSEILRRLAGQWIEESGAALARSKLLDLAYIQHRLAGWAGPAVQGHAIPKPTFPPFNCARIYERMLELPEDARVGAALPQRLISAARPELLQLPFNRAKGAARLFFPKQELKRHIPPQLTSRLRAMVRGRLGRAVAKRRVG